MIKGYLEITKKDSDTYPDDPYINLEGVVFKVYSDEGLTNLVDTLTTNASGIAKSKKLAPGTYYVKETSAPSVYQVNDTVYPVVIQYSEGQGERITPLTVTNTKKNGSFALRKLSNYDKTTLLPDAVFKLTSVNSPDVSYTLTTDSNGYAARQNIEPGHYRLTEITAPIGYTAMSDMNGDGVDDPDGLLIDVYPGRTTEEVVVIYNQPEEATVLVTKSQKGNSSVRLEGVQFALYKDSVSSENKIGDSKLTDANGNVSWSNLVQGSYILVEEATITGYIMPDDPNTEFTLEPGERQVIKIDNTATPGSVKVVKRDAYYKNTLAGAEFWLYKGDLVGGEPQGEVIDKKTTGADGVVTFGGLTIGATYVVVEKVAPANYTLQPGSGNIQVVTVTTPNGEETLAFHNEPVKGSLRVNKTIDGSPAGNTLDAVSFRLVGPYVDATTGTEITGFTPVTEEKALTNGAVTFSNLLHGQYRLYEVADRITGGNYNVMQNYRVVTVGLGGEVVEEDVDNQIIKGYLEINKEDANTYPGDTYINLEGVVFEVYSDAALTNVVDTLTTDASGYAKSKLLTPGTYFVKETSAPSVYQENSTVYEVEILWSQGQGERITNLKVTNVKKTGDFALRKLSYFDKSKALVNAVFSMTNINDSSLVYTMTTGNDGYATKLNIVPGKYKLREVTAPVGYMAMADMDDDGTDDPDGLLVEIYPSRTTTGEDVITVYNQPSKSTAVVAKFQKGDHSIRLQGVRFALYKDSVSATNKIGNSQ